MESDNNNAPQASKILPIPGERNVLVTSALPYVNNVPHLGNIIGSVLSADCYARYIKGRGINCLFVCGTDEYGTATETKALVEKMTPKEICDKYNKIHAEVYDWFDIKFDEFGRTSTEEQTKVCHEIFWDLQKNGHITEGELEQLFCEKCQKFLADRYVEGTCNLCGFPDARGDQCDGCGKLLNAVELIEPRCKVDGSRPIVRSSKHLFLDLPKLTPVLEKWVESASKKGGWSNNSCQITNAWLKEGLKPRCITRDLKWGTPVPLEGFENKVFYVWFDAPIGYISITAGYTPEWEKWWKNPEQVELFQFMGKDNIPFHTVIFPSSLLGTNEKWTMLHHVSTCEYLNYEGGKFSKSRGEGVFGDAAKETGIPSSVWRYYLLSNRPETQDSSFSWDDLIAKNNNEIIANFGNFVNRALTFLTKEFSGIVPEVELNEEDNELISEVNKKLKEYISELDQVHIKDGLKIAMSISQLGNGYMQKNKPWELVKTDKKRCGTVLATLVNLVRLLASLFEPYMPTTHDNLLSQLNCSRDVIPNEWNFKLKSGHKLGTPSLLFQTIDAKQAQIWKSKFGGKQEKKSDEFSLDIRAGIVRSVEPHPEDSQLYLLKVSLGGNDPDRNIVGRLAATYKKEELLNRRVFVLCNLPPAQLKGHVSEGMLLVAESKKGQALLEAPSQPDDKWEGKVEVNGIPTISPMVNTNLKAFQKTDLKLVDGKVVYLGKHPLTLNDVPIGAPVTGAAKIR
eukprot:TRINITY_DN3354_c0_g1_i1.p1 TRINITY_DN3354_c0_g1~~TRINITY_DN3354_c0_g1_i1.p1  ORF type:complete len:738 (+),score=238.98 TRINITY_DN3354_c0_g1_i1:39-2252(+)